MTSAHLNLFTLVLKDRKENKEMKRLLAVWLTALLYVMVIAAAYPSAGMALLETKTLQPSKDNTLIESETGSLSSGKGPTIFVGRTGQAEGSIRRGLIAFDFASAIPAHSRITSVKLTLNLTLSAGGGQPARVTLHRLLKDWGEGESTAMGGRGAQAAKGDASWIYSVYDTEKWAHAGGDYITKSSGVQTVSDVGTYTWGSTPQMVADVQSWVDKRKGNFGWLLVGDEIRGATAKVFHSRDSSDEQARPKLIVTFAPGRKK